MSVSTLRTKADLEQDTLQAIYLLVRLHIGLSQRDSLVAYTALSNAIRYLQRGIYPRFK